MLWEWQEGIARLGSLIPIRFYLTCRYLYSQHEGGRLPPHGAVPAAV